MTTSTEAMAAAGLNGQAPPASANGTGSSPQETSIGERLMGVIGVAFAVGLLLIGLDLMTGGAVARAFTSAGGGDQGAGSGG